MEALLFTVPVSLICRSGPLKVLSLSFLNLLYEDAGHRIPSGDGVIVSIVPMAVTNPESHAHLSFVNVITVALNVADSMRVYSCAGHIQNTING